MGGERERSAKLTSKKHFHTITRSKFFLGKIFAFFLPEKI
jgi:hypothetical protein